MLKKSESDFVSLGRVQKMLEEIPLNKDFSVATNFSSSAHQNFTEYTHRSHFNFFWKEHTEGFGKYLLSPPSGLQFLSYGNLFLGMS